MCNCGYSSGTHMFSSVISNKFTVANAVTKKHYVMLTLCDRNFIFINIRRKRFNAIVCTLYKTVHCLHKMYLQNSHHQIVHPR